MGLGLTISKMIAEKFGGNITFKSQHEKGSTFIFTILLQKRDPVISEFLE